MPNIGFPELVLLVAPWILLLWILFRIVGGWRRRGAQLDRIERRLDDIDRREGGEKRPD